MAAQPSLVTPVLQVVHRVITDSLHDQAGLNAGQADSGAPSSGRSVKGGSKFILQA